MTNSQACLKSGENIIKTLLNISSEIADSALDNFGEVVVLLVDMNVCFFLLKLLRHSPTDDSQTESDRRKQQDKKKRHINYLVSKRVA